MATFSTVLWQPDDEITSEKLNQMASNEQYLNDNIIKTTMVYNITTDPTYGNAVGGNAGRWWSGITNGTRPAVVGAAVLAAFDFNYGAPVPQVDFNVVFPGGIFTQPPIAVATITQTLDPLVCWIPDNSAPDHCRVSVQRNDGQSQALWGFCIMVIAQGI